jgi:hypothetical protein
VNVALIPAALAACLVTVAAFAQSLDTSDFNASAARGLSNPSVMSPPVQRADMLAAVFEHDASAVTADTLVTYHAISGSAGCADVMLMRNEELEFSEVLARAVEGGVSLRTSVSVAGTVDIWREGSLLLIDHRDLARMVLPGLDASPCSWRRVGIIEEFSVSAPSLPPIDPGPSMIDDLQVSLARTGRACAQLSGRLGAHSVEGGKYHVSLDVDTVRMGAGFCARASYAAASIAPGADPHLFDYMPRDTRLISEMVEPVPLRNYVLSAVRQEDGSWLWGAEVMQLTADGTPFTVFEPLVRR